MANPKNTADLAELKEKIAESSSIVITEYRGLTVAQLQELRGNLALMLITPSPRTPSSRSLPTKLASKALMNT